MNLLNGKKVLLLAPSFFGYYIKIKECLEDKGAFVHVIKENFSDQSILYRYFFIKSEKRKFRYAKRYYRKEIEQAPNDFDYVLMIRGEAVDSEAMELLKKKYPEAYYIMYQWDSVHNNPNALNICKFFDRCLTFDPKDAVLRGWIYRPLFYLKESEKQYQDKAIDFILIGTLYYKRAELLKKVRQFCEVEGYSFSFHLFVRRLEFFAHKYIMHDRRYSVLDKSDVRFYPLTSSDVNKLYDNSKIFVDYAADDQDGLTMRTIESLGNRSKIITNNKNIINSDLYNPNNVFVYDLENFELDKDFVDSPYVPLGEAVYEKYSLNGWIEDVFKVIC